MKRDVKLICRILDALSESPALITVMEPSDFSVPPLEFYYAVELASKAGLICLMGRSINLLEIGLRGKETEPLDMEITWEGHDYLEDHKED